MRAPPHGLLSMFPFYVLRRVVNVEPKAEDRLTQLAGSVLKNGFAGYEQKVGEGDVVWAKSGGSSRTLSKSPPKPSARTGHRPSVFQAASSSSLLASPALALGGRAASTAGGVPRVEGSGKRFANGEKGGSLEATQDGGPFALLVLEGSVTAVFESAGQGTRPGGGRTHREQVLGPGTSVSSRWMGRGGADVLGDGNQVFCWRGASLLLSGVRCSISPRAGEVQPRSRTYVLIAANSRGSRPP